VKEARETITSKQTKSYATIVVVNKHTGDFRPFIATEFIRKKYATGKNFNTQRAPAQDIKRFLNWLFIENVEKYQLETLEHLRFHHGVEYLDYLKTRNKMSTVRRVENYLKHFYNFLYQQNVLPEDMKLEPEKTLWGEASITSPFSEGATQSYKDDEFEERLLHDFPDPSLILPFMEVAQRIAPEIAFGIYLQFHGGLRRGEVVNLNEAALEMKGSFGSRGMKAIIKERPILFDRLRDNTKNRVKRPRTQPIQVMEYGPVMYKKLLHYLDIHRGNQPGRPLFVDENGLPMSGAVYEKRFAKVKKAFLKELMVKNYPDYYVIAKKDWSTHVGRGVYTNMMAHLVKTPMELALLRGDKSLDASVSYMAHFKIIKEVEEGMENMYAKMKKDYKEKYADSDSDVANKDREQLGIIYYSEQQGANV